ncbi:hypothetical protein [Nocardioides yefusunii]|uniref:Fibronectin type-III domain-containing protein n=1 Tax=Nocardioides yefusunii TaxID=2500546 RepID=A0ABW1QUY2_9ACTN|nr:hypothetical protein [Nocardioides yefusunii]
MRPTAALSASLSLVLGLTTGAALALPATAAAPVPAPVVDVALPQSSNPLLPTVLGATTDGIWVVDPGTEWSRQIHAHGTAGRVTSPDDGRFAELGQLVGSHWISSTGTGFRWSRVEDRSAGEQNWFQSVTPPQHDAMAAVPGHVVARGPWVDGSRETLVLSYSTPDSSTSRPLPSTRSGYVDTVKVVDERHAVVRHEDGVDLVDLVAMTARALPDGSESDGTEVCASPRYGSTPGFSVNTTPEGTRLAWTVRDESGTYVCSSDIDDAPAADRLEVDVLRSNDERVRDVVRSFSTAIPVAGGVVIAPEAPRTNGSDSSVVFVGNDGGVRTLADWATTVVPLDDGTRVATVGLRDGVPTLARLTPLSGAVEWLPSTWPRSAQVQHLAISGDRLSVTDDRLASTSASAYTVTPEGASAPEILAADAQGIVLTGRDASGDPVQVWSPKQGASQIRTSDGVRDLGSGGSPRWSHTDGRWALTSGRVFDVAAGASTTEPMIFTGLQQGVAWRIERGTSDLAPARLVLSDVASGRSVSHPAPQCGALFEAQVAGSIALAQCSTSQGWVSVVKDLRSHGDWTVLDVPETDLYLGNGFILGVPHDSPAEQLSPWWIPTNDLNAERRTISVPSSIWGHPVAVTTDATASPSFAFVVSQGVEATVRVGFPQVSTTPAITVSTGTTRPARPAGMEVQVGENAARVLWDAPSQEPPVASYRVEAVIGSAVVASVDLRPQDVERTREGRLNVELSFPYVAPWSTATFRITATNEAGSTAAVVEDARRNFAPAAPTDLSTRLTPDGRTIVAWSWDRGTAPNSRVGLQDLVGFDVAVDGLTRNPTRIGAGVREFTLPASFHGKLTLTVLARGTFEVSTSAPLVVTVPRVPQVGHADHPTLSLAKVVTGSGVSARVNARTATTARVDVQVRTTTATGASGRWTSPASLQKLALTRGARTVPLTKIATGAQVCLRTRARDDFGNVSDWSDQTCTVRAFDDRAFTPRSRQRTVKAKATRLAGKKYAAGTATRLGATGAAGRHTVLDGPRTNGHAGWLVATTCPTCGKVRVEIRSGAATTTSKVIDLRSKKTKHQVLKSVRGLGPLKKGTVRIIRVSGKPVIDGIALHR